VVSVISLECIKLNISNFGMQTDRNEHYHFHVKMPQYKGVFLTVGEMLNLISQKRYMMKI